MKLTLYGRPITKKNNPRVVMTGRYPKVLPSKQYQAYEEACLLQITGKYRQKIDYPINLKCLYYMPTRHKVDITNLMSATHDILVSGQVIDDDNSKIVKSVDGTRVYLDRDKPRVEIEIEEYKE